MAIVIKGMKMPKNCNGCDFMCCLRHFNILNDDRPSDCPIIAELPEKHGDLIYRDTLKSAVLKWMPPDPCGVEEREYPFETDICASLLQEIERQPTIIEAEED